MASNSRAGSSPARGTQKEKALIFGAFSFYRWQEGCQIFKIGVFLS